ncbi:hypothetical protein CB1_000402007 [Camelus ferus]|nr:hypothetical protein CB1_000402007 [Camelus ferus]
MKARRLCLQPVTLEDLEPTTCRMLVPAPQRCTSATSRKAFKGSRGHFLFTAARPGNEESLQEGKPLITNISCLFPPDPAYHSPSLASWATNGGPTSGGPSNLFIKDLQGRVPQTCLCCRFFSIYTVSPLRGAHRFFSATQISSVPENTRRKSGGTGKKEDQRQVSSSGQELEDLPPTPAAAPKQTPDIYQHHGSPVPDAGDADSNIRQRGISAGDRGGEDGRGLGDGREQTSDMKVFES